MTALSGSLMISIVVVVLAVGALVPLFVRWRKRKLLEQTADQNLSFTHEASSEAAKSDKPDIPKAA
jgi:type II secretory pathway pseudopilin PulG